MAAVDTYPGSPAQNVGAEHPANNAAPVTPSDAADLAFISRSLVIGTAGDLKVTTRGTRESPGETVVLVGVPAGILPLRVTKVFATGTTATNISALW